MRGSPKADNTQVYIGNDIYEKEEIQRLHVGWYDYQKCHTALIFSVVVIIRGEYLCS